ncbi:SGNH/GDSL hydrolase family protein [Marinilactibacillus psychrotolerans]|uniref:SGNH/GDSL hydrolase family protein n=1 Tax=Marinilactibacillus psychrotolerans TaxID=191770 RepID=UPI00388B25A4
MADLIQRLDSLNQGREKINKGIEASERAEQKSDTSLATSSEAKQTAEEANGKSDHTQKQLDKVVGASTIDPAVEQMKVGSDGQTVYDSPDERVRTENRNITAQLAQKSTYDTIWNLDNMGQDVKEAMTGGSVAVVGDDAVMTNNIRDKAVTVSKLAGDSVIHGKNIYERDTHDTPGFIDGTGTGELKPSETAMVADIPVKPNTQYSLFRPSDNQYSSATGYIHFLDGDKNLVSQFIAADYISGEYQDKNYFTVTTPNNTGFIRINVNMGKYDDRDELICILGDTISDEIMNAAEVSKLLDVGLHDVKTRQQVKDLENSFQVEGGNRYKYTDHFTPNTYANVDGEVKPAAGWGLATVPAKPMTDYSLWIEDGNYSGRLGAIIFLDEKQATIDFAYPASDYTNGHYKTNDYITLHTPANTSYIAVTVKGITTDTTFDYSTSFIMVQGDTLTDDTLVAKLVGYKDALILNDQSAKPYDGVKWTAVGDSLTEINLRSSKFYHEYLSDELGFTVENMGISGTGYKRRDDENLAIYQRINDVPLDSDVVTIFGSFNDLGASVPVGTASDTGTDTLAGAINTTIDNLYSILPTVPLGIISPTPWHGSNLTNPTGIHAQYVQVLEDICKRRGIPFLNLYYSSGLRPWDEEYRTLMYSKDPVGNGTHPDENGHKLIAPQFREFIKTLI